MLLGGCGTNHAFTILSISYVYIYMCVCIDRHHFTKINNIPKTGGDKIHLNFELPLDFQDVEFLPSQGSFAPYFLEIVVEVKASGLHHDLKLLLVVNNGIVYVKYFHSHKASFCVS